MKKSSSVLKHLFNVHTICDKSNCYPKCAEDENKEYVTTKDHQFYCEEKIKII